MEERFTVEDIARKYGVEGETVRRWIRSGELNAEKDVFSRGKPFEVTALELERFEKERRLRA